MFPANRVACALIVCSVFASSAATIPESWSGSDPRVRPGVDFFRFANGGWLDQTMIPPDRAGYSIAAILNQSSETKVHDLLEAAAVRAGDEPSDEQGKVGAYYAAFMDQARVEALGGAPLQGALKKIRSASSRSSLAAIMGEATAVFQTSLFKLSIEPDSHNADRYAVYLSQGGLGTLDRSVYLDPKTTHLRQSYAAYVARMLTLIGWSGARPVASKVLTFETEVAAASWSPGDDRNESKIYNPLTLRELADRAPGFPWKVYLGAAKLSHVRRLIIVESTALPTLARLFATQPVSVLKAWAAFHLADNAATVLSSEFTDAWFGFHGRQIDGERILPPRWRRALEQVSGNDGKGIENSRGAMGDAVGRLYISRWFDSRSRQALSTMVGEIETTLRVRIVASYWISMKAKTAALRKADAYRVEIGAPQHSDHYDGLLIRRDDLFGDVERATANAWTHDIAHLNGPVDRLTWSITPQTVNAYNYAPFSEVVFTAALLQPPAFDERADPAITYGGIGAIIGHELTHSYDDTGRRFDASGQLRDWWTAADDARFAAKAARLVALYSSCDAAPGLHVNGAQTLGENLADIGGLQLAFAAYHASLHGHPAPVIGGLTGDQRFFLGFALLRRGKRRPEALRGDIATDLHTPDACRVNETVRNVDGWYSAFGVKPGDPLFLSTNSRTKIW